VVGDLRVQAVERGDGTRAYTIVWPEGAVHAEADRFLRTREPGTDRTYAYLLVDHLRWLERECPPLGSVTLADLQRYPSTSSMAEIPPRVRCRHFPQHLGDVDGEMRRMPT
jgi:hypothetical protein